MPRDRQISRPHAEHPITTLGVHIVAGPVDLSDGGYNMHMLLPAMPVFFRTERGLFRGEGGIVISPVRCEQGLAGMSVWIH